MLVFENWRNSAFCRDLLGRSQLARRESQFGRLLRNSAIFSTSNDRYVALDRSDPRPRIPRIIARTCLVLAWHPLRVASGVIPSVKIGLEDGALISSGRLGRCMRRPSGLDQRLDLGGIMSSISWRSVIRSGLIAGIVWIVLGSVVTAGLGRDFAAIPGNRLGAPSAGFVSLNLAIDLLEGYRSSGCTRRSGRAMAPAPKRPSSRRWRGGSSSPLVTSRGARSASFRRARSSH